ncbi:MAG: hypothetical protein WA375_03550, partial [Pseudolabrys sp.]
FERHPHSSWKQTFCLPPNMPQYDLGPAVSARTTDGAATMAAETARKERRLSPDMMSNRLLEADRMPEPASSSKFYG